MTAHLQMIRDLTLLAPKYGDNPYQAAVNGVETYLEGWYYYCSSVWLKV